jgi:2-keto-4-pentenoate hydratase/2-oxohepta-3-ene-1,7-dioic acid hydratase in catechol pathway
VGLNYGEHVRETGREVTETPVIFICLSEPQVARGQVMSLQTVLDGQVLQDTTTDKMIHSIPRQIAYISTFIPLFPDDVIVTGTPGGVGNKQNPQIFMKPGDVCEIVVDAIGTLPEGIRD